MHIKTSVFGQSLLMGLALAVALPAAARAENEPTGYVCTFAKGTSWTFEDGAFKDKAPEAMGFTIADIDLEKQSAKLQADGAAAPGELKIVRAINANHFLEVVNEGFLNLTTVYDKDDASGVYPAVHSRHFGVLGQPVIAQYTGTCTAK
ncbi:hypothetical protein [Hyphomicrobium sp. D-2]|uniref:hypothetical protein n=1 Tax=Hyphomicrobium sp. D-2 TaxID=3041621 RepID=UPI0024576FA5|nr:hypothetical protein [Hyphomicrobium sp. D-2]MDH4982810.1 hypothetical protein [Hyphomicrobium sp. D-2]